MQSIIFIGTSHVAKDSVKKVKKVISEKKPDIVAIELDRNRLLGLLDKKSKRKLSFGDIKRIGLKGWLFASIGQWIQKKIGSKIGVLPGADMLAAYNAAKSEGAKIALVDQDIEKTLKNLSKRLSWKERWNFVVDLIKGFVFKKGIKIDLSKVPEDELIEKLIKKLKIRYPNIYDVLIAERNDVIAKNIAKLTRNFPDANIVVVLGAGHVKEVKDLLKKYLKEYDII